MCKDGVRVLNFARGELVDNAALLDALNSGKVAQYFCDFPTEELLGVKGVCCTPHLGASTPESETNCAVMAAAELSDYLKTATYPTASTCRMSASRAWEAAASASSTRTLRARSRPSRAF